MQFTVAKTLGAHQPLRGLQRRRLHVGIRPAAEDFRHLGRARRSARPGKSAALVDHRLRRAAFVVDQPRSRDVVGCSHGAFRGPSRARSGALAVDDDRGNHVVTSWSRVGKRCPIASRVKSPTQPSPARRIGSPRSVDPNPCRTSAGYPRARSASRRFRTPPRRHRAPDADSSRLARPQRSALRLRHGGARRGTSIARWVASRWGTGYGRKCPVRVATVRSTSRCAAAPRRRRRQPSSAVSCGPKFGRPSVSQLAHRFQNSSRSLRLRDLRPGGRRQFQWPEMETGMSDGLGVPSPDQLEPLNVSFGRPAASVSRGASTHHRVGRWPGRSR